MERVFGGAPALPDDSRADEARADAAGRTAAPLPLPAAAAPRPIAETAPARSRRWLLLAAPALAALFAIALAVRFALTLVPDNAAAPASERARPVAYSAAAARPAPAAVADTAGEDRREALTPDDFGPAPVDEQLPPRPAAIAAAEQVQDVPPPVRARTTRRRAGADDCPPGSDADHCIYRDVVGADRRLRAAYDDATRAGVPTEELVAVRRRWDRARAISLREPDETIRRYDNLAERLDDLTRIQQR